MLPCLSTTAIRTQPFGCRHFERSECLSNDSPSTRSSTIRKKVTAPAFICYLLCRKPSHRLSINPSFLLLGASNFLILDYFFSDWISSLNQILMLSVHTSDAVLTRIWVWRFIVIDSVLVEHSPPKRYFSHNNRIKLTLHEQMVDKWLQHIKRWCWIWFLPVYNKCFVAPFGLISSIQILH